MSHIQLRSRLSEILGRHRIKQTTLAYAAGIRVATIHSLYHSRTARIDYKQAIILLEALERLTGVRYTLGDLIETLYTDTDQPTDQGPGAGAAGAAGAADPTPADQTRAVKPRRSYGAGAGAADPKQGKTS